MDVSGDGVPDDVWLYVESDEVFVHVAFGEGGSARVDLDAAGDGLADIALTADVDGDGLRELWITVGGASAPILGLVTISECQLREVVTENGEPFQLWTGGSPLELAGVLCHAGKIEFGVFHPATDAEGVPRFHDRGQLERRVYELEDATAVLTQERNATQTPPPYIGDLSCGPP